MKKIWFTIMLSFACLGFCSADLAGYTIDSYDANFTLTKKGILEVVEDINVDFTEHRHGLYRAIPYLYSNYLKTPIKNVKVSLDKFSTSTQGKNYIIKIGDPQKTIIGKKSYSIGYKIKGSVREFSGYQELYWNMLGTDWNVPVNNFKFSLSLPTDLDLSEDDIWVYIGERGSTNTIKATKSGNIISIDEPLNLGAHEGVTLAVKLPSNYVPTKKYLSLGGWLRYNYKYSIIAIWCIVGAGILFFVIRAGKKYYKALKQLKETREMLVQTHGKKIRDVIHFSLPEGYTPAEISAILRWKSDYNSLAAILFSWIGDGYVIFEENTHRNWLGIKKKTYRFKANTNNPRFKFDESRKEGDFLHFQDPEEKFWNLCFVKGDINNLETFTFKDSESLKKICDEIFYTIQSRFIPNWDAYRKISYDITARYKARSRKKMGIHSSKNPSKSYMSLTSKFYFLLSVQFCWLLALIFLIMSAHQTDGLGAAMFGMICLFSSFILYAFIFVIVGLVTTESHKGNELKYINEEGIDVLEQTFGFKKYLMTVDDKKLQTLLKDDPTYFEKILPYAVALGIGNHWIKKCVKNFKNIDTVNLESLPDTDWVDAVSSKIDLESCFFQSKTKGFI